MQIVPADTENGPDLDPLVAKVRERLGIAEDDSRLEMLMGAVGAAYASIDGPSSTIGRTLLTRDWDVVLDGFGWRPIPLPLPPLQAVVSVKYVDTDGVVQTLDPTTYRIVLGTPARLVPAFGKSWPALYCGVGNLTIRIKAGYGSVADIPEPILTAIALQARHALSLAAQSLFLAREKVEGVGEQQFIVSESAGNAIAAAVNNLVGPYRVIL